MAVIRLFGDTLNNKPQNDSESLNLGYDENGNVTVKSNITDKAKLLLLVETFRQSLMNGGLDGN